MSLSCVPAAGGHGGDGSWAVSNGCVSAKSLLRRAFQRRRRLRQIHSWRAKERRATLVLSGLLAAILAFGATARPASAQSAAASVSGIVEDETSAAIAHADVSVLNPDTGFQRSAATDDRGYFVIPLLPVGTYVLTAQMPGFGVVAVKDVVVHAGIDVSLTIRLKPKGITETIDVIADDDGASSNGSRVSRLDTTDAAAKYSVTNREVMSLPVFANELGRNTLQSLPFLVPGVTPNTTLGALSGLNVAGIAVRGSRSSSVSFNIEGGDDNDDEYNLALAGLPNPDALEEFTFITSNYGADLGRSSGGIINAVVKSGTNHLRGNVRYLGIDDKLNARGFFDQRTPLFRLNNFGGQLGGPARLPLLRSIGERLSFFADYEGTRSRRESTETFQVPSQAERNGDFSSLPAAQQPLDPLSNPNLFRRTPFPGGRIPVDRLNPIALAYLKLFIPAPNSGDHNFTELLPTRFGNDQGTLRLDYGLSSRDNVNLIFLSASSRIAQPSGFLPADSQYLEDGRSYDLIVHHTHVLGNSAVNQVTASFARYGASLHLLSPGGTGRDPSTLGFAGLHPQTQELLGVPSLEFSQVSRVVSVSMESTNKTVFQGKDDFIRTIGRNSIKFGAEIRWYGGQENSSIVPAGGEFLFSQYTLAGSKNELGNFLLGLPDDYIQSTGSSAYPRRWSYQVYGMDDLHVRPDLTINFGLRYDLTPPAVDGRDQVSAFRAGQQSSVIPRAPAGLIFVGDQDPVLGHLPRGLYRTDFRDFAPRVGLAFVPGRLPWFLNRLLGNAKTSVRAGWGVFYDHTSLDNSTRISIATEPFSAYVVVPIQGNASFAAPFGTSLSPFPVDLKQRPFSFYPNIFSIDPSFRTPYSYGYDIIIQREVTPATTLEFSYFGASSFRTVRDRELNPAMPEPGATGGYLNVQSRRLYPDLGTIVSAESTGRASSNSFQVQVRRRFSRGIMFQASYVLSESRDNGGPLFTTVFTDPLIWARSPFDRRHNAVFSFSYDLPGLKLRHTGGLLSNWRMSGIAEFRSGLPLDIYQSGITAQTDASVNTAPDLTGPFRRIDPRKAQTRLASGVLQSGHFFFDPSGFSVVSPAQGRIGNLPRLAFDGPGFNMWSISVAKSYRLVHDQRIQIRADIRNLFNHANFDSPNVQVDCPGFGQVNSAAPGRTIQYSVRYVF